MISSILLHPERLHMVDHALRHDKVKPTTLKIYRLVGIPHEAQERTNVILGFVFLFEDRILTGINFCRKFQN